MLETLPNLHHKVVLKTENGFFFFFFPLEISDCAASSLLILVKTAIGVCTHMISVIFFPPVLEIEGERKKKKKLNKEIS